jgi:hypothetical protein
MYDYRPIIPPKHEHRLLGLILISLYFVFWAEKSTGLPQIFLFLHCLLLLLWQPLWAGRSPTNIKHISIFTGFALFISIFFNLWILSLWQIILIGLIGGRDLIKPRDRFINIIAITYLAINLFIINLQSIFVIEGMGVSTLLNMSVPIKYGLLSIPLLFLFFSSSDKSIEHHYPIDFFHALTLSLLMIILCLSSIITMLYGKISYPVAVFQVAMATVLFIIVFSWLWIIFAEKENIGQIWTEHILNIGNSLEQQISNIIHPHDYKALTPKEFLKSGLKYMANSLPWIVSIQWQSDLYNSNGTIGNKKSKHFITINLESIEVTVYSHDRISGTHYFQAKLLLQLLEYSHQAKRRENAFAQQAHLQGIYETGARLTHDIKNVLQYLLLISAGVETSGVSTKIIYMDNNMPHVVHRLKQILDKLKAPSELTVYSHIPITLWWENLQARYRKYPVVFLIDGGSKKASSIVSIPEDLFDNVVENLLQNAIMKSKREFNLKIKVSLVIKHTEPGKKMFLKISICDDGTAIPTDIAQNLLTQRVPSKDGFGIGLYHAAKQSKLAGYQLVIAENREGKVCFELSK